MPIPEGYEKLAVIGIVNKGEYSEDGEYKQYNYVYYQGSTYLALRDNPEVPPTNNKTDWQYLAQGVVGAKGDKGEPGAKGEQGVSITDARIEEGVLHITLSDERDITVGSVAITKDAVVDALGYTPAGGENLVLDSGTTISNSDYRINIYKLSEPLKPNEKYTVTIWGDIKENKIPYVYIGGGNHALNPGALEKQGDGSWILKGGIPSAATTEEEYKKTEIWIYMTPKDTVETSTINRIKLEPGIVTDPVWTPAPEDVVVRSELPISLNLIFPKNAGAHNSVFRGNDLGTSVTETQYAAINNGSFDDIFVGDYWTINNTVYRVAGLDIFLHVGDIELTKHHAVIVPDINMYTHRMNETNTTAKAYQGSEMKTSGLSDALTTVQAAFGAEHILKHKVLLVNTISENDPSGWAWHESQIDLMTERQVYGSPTWGQAAHNGYDANMQYSRFPLFSLAPEFICKSRSWYWLQDVRSASYFCAVGYDGGTATDDGASTSGGVRPYFLIGVA